MIWRLGFTITYYVLFGVEKTLGDITPELMSLGVPEAGISAGVDVIRNATDTVSLLAVSILGLILVRRSTPEAE